MNVIIGSLKLHIINDFMEAFQDKDDKVFSVQNADIAYISNIS